MPQKLLILSHSFLPTIGGLEMVAEMLVKGLHGAGYEVHLVTWTEGAPEDSIGFTVIRKPGLIRLLQEHAWADMVLEHNPCLRLSWPCLFYRRPHITTIHTWISRTDGRIAWRDKLKVAWLRQSAKVLACSDALRLQIWPPALVIGNPYRSELFRLLPGMHRRFSFVFVGRLVSDKGVEVAIRAFHRLFSTQWQHFHDPFLPVFTIIGEGPERDQLQALTCKLGIEEQIRFAGSLSGPKLAAVLNEHQIILIPSVWEEPFGIVALEGMACGCVPIASNCGGLPEAIGKAGLTVPKGDVRALCDAMRYLLLDPIAIVRFRKAAPPHLEQFKPERINKRYEAVIAEMALAN